MSPRQVIREPGKPVAVQFVPYPPTVMIIWLDDGLAIGVLLRQWLPHIQEATTEQRNNYRLSDYGIHWPDLDQDISIAGLLGMSD